MKLIKPLVIIEDKWYVVHPAHSASYVLRVVRGADIPPTATNDRNAILNANPQIWEGHRLVNFNHLDYVDNGPYESQQEAREVCRFSTSHNFALWGSADDDRPGDNNRR